MKIIVPMRGHASGLHAGHIELINYAKTLSDDVVVWISPSIHSKHLHYFHGTEIKTKLEDITLQIETIKSLGVKVAYRYRRKFKQLMSEETRIKLLQRVEEEWNLLKAGVLKNVSIRERDQTLAFTYVIGHIRRQSSLNAQNHTVLFGPEPVAFILKSWKRVFDYLPEYLIYSKIVKKDGIKIESFNATVPREQWEEVEKTIYTGDFADGGRLEVTLYNTGVGLVEDVTYDIS